MAIKNLRFVDPVTGEEFDAVHIENPAGEGRSMEGEFRYLAEITQFGIWGTKSYVIMQQVSTGYCFFYILETFDFLTKKRSKRSGNKAG